MTTELVIEELRGMLESAKEWGDTDGIDMIQTAISIIDCQRWIPCSERLPIIKNNIGAKVLVTTSWGLVKEAYYRVDHWEINDIPYKLTSIIAWMPLPKPYEMRGERG